MSHFHMALFGSKLIFSVNMDLSSSGEMLPTFAYFAASPASSCAV